MGSQDDLSCGWKVDHTVDGRMEYASALPEADIRLWRLISASSTNLRKLRQHGFRVQVVPATATRSK